MLPADCHGPQANVKVLYQPEGKAARNASTATNWKCLLWERMADPTVASESASVCRHLFPSRGLRPRIVPHSSIALAFASPILGHEPGITYHGLRYLLL